MKILDIVISIVSILGFIAFARWGGVKGMVGFMLGSLITSLMLFYLFEKKQDWVRAAFSLLGDKIK